MSDEIAQLASVVIALEAEADSEENWTGEDFRRIKILKGREGEAKSFRVKFDMMYTAVEEEIDETAQTTTDEGPDHEEDEPWETDQ